MLVWTENIAEGLFMGFLLPGSDLRDFVNKWKVKGEYKKPH